MCKASKENKDGSEYKLVITFLSSLLKMYLPAQIVTLYRV